MGACASRGRCATGSRRRRARRARDATRRAPCSRAAARTRRRRIRRPPGRCLPASSPAHVAHDSSQQPLHRMIAPLVPVRRPAGRLRAGEHRGVLARAVVVEARESRAGLAQQPAARATRAGRAGRRRGRLPRARCRSSICSRERDVLRLAAMRRAGERQLIVAPMQLVEAAGLEQRHDLKWLRAGAPRAHDARIVRRCDERIRRRPTTAACTR